MGVFISIQSLTHTMTTVQPTFNIRPIQRADNAAIAQVIRTVSAEFGLGADMGFAVADPTLDSLYEAYHQPCSAYWVIEQAGVVVGGGGLSPLQGAPDIIELQKMYILPQARGYGLARQIIDCSLTFARQRGFSQCYLETTASLQGAIKLYEKLGFRHLAQPLGNSGHHSCEVWMVKDLINIST